MKKGQSLVEIILVTSLLAIIAPTLISLLSMSAQGRPQERQRIKAITYLNETQEALRNIREKSWASINSDGIFHTEIDAANHSWKLIANEFTNANNFTQKIEITSVNRDVTGKIADTGTFDPSTKKVVTTISWVLPQTSFVTSTIYLTRYLDNMSYTHTTDAHFNAGLTGTW